MLKMALLDYAINEKCCTLTAGRVIWQFKSPHPREFAIQGKKNANALGSAGRAGAGRSWNWLMYKDLYGKLCKRDWVAKVVFLIQMLLTFGRCGNRYFWDIRLKIPAQV